MVGVRGGRRARLEGRGGPCCGRGPGRTAAAAAAAQEAAAHAAAQRQKLLF